MGSIVWIEPNPDKWKAHYSKYKTRVTGEPLLIVTYGTFDDYDTCELETFMRESVYNKLISGEYHVDKNDKRNLIILDKNDSTVESYCSGAIY